MPFLNDAAAALFRFGFWRPSVASFRTIFTRQLPSCSYWAARAAIGGVMAFVLSKFAWPFSIVDCRHYARFRAILLQTKALRTT